MKLTTPRMCCAFTAPETRLKRQCERCGCSICAELRGTSPPLHTSRIPGAEASRILRQNDEWALLPTIGPLAPGHIMLVPQKHYYSILACPEHILFASREILSECASRLGATYNQEVLFFEHGATAGGQKTCGACIDHAHLHIVPGPTSFILSAMSKVGPWTAADSLDDLRAEAEGFPYLLVGSLSTGMCWLYRCSQEVPSQFLRKVLATELKSECSWDWRKEPNADAFLQTLIDWRA